MAKGRKTEGALGIQSANLLRMADTVLKLNGGKDCRLEAELIGTMGRYTAHKGDTELAETVTGEAVYGIMATLYNAAKKI